MFDKVSNYKKSLYINLGIILAVIAVFVLFFILLRLNILHQVEIINNIKSKDAYISESAGNLASLIKDEAIVKDYYQRVSLLVPSEGDLVTLQKDINEIARQDNVSLTFNFGAESNPTGVGTLGSISFTAIADGSMDQILSFLKDVENKYYSLTVNALELDRPSAGLIHITLSGQISYYQQ